jgi:hypothetical protein
MEVGASTVVARRYNQINDGHGLRLPSDLDLGLGLGLGCRALAEVVILWWWWRWLTVVVDVGRWKPDIGCWMMLF